ncbi:MAG: hypothetical protein II670_11855 [Alphaproteobacteria bacterium]|nr:hypothetical protein [Alphaproteobacteria bacterium]
MKKDMKELIGQVSEPRYIWIKHIAYHCARNTGKYDRSIIESIKDGLTTEEFIYYHTFILEEYKRIFREYQERKLRGTKRVINVKKHKKNRFPIEDA